MGKIAIITGIAGQDGSYLSELLLSKNYKVFGIYNSKKNINKFRIPYINKRINYLKIDINNFNMFTDNLTSNPIVQSRFPGWAGFKDVDKPELKQRAGFDYDAKI